MHEQVGHSARNIIIPASTASLPNGHLGETWPMSHRLRLWVLTPQNGVMPGLDPGIHRLVYAVAVLALVHDAMARGLTRLERPLDAVLVAFALLWRVAVSVLMRKPGAERL